MTPNPEWKKVAASIIAAVVFTVLCLVSYFFIDGMSGGFAIAFVSFFLAVSGIVIALLFFTRARPMDTILSDPSPIAHWIYPDEMARAGVEREYREFQARNRAMFIIIGGMLAVVALFFFLFVSEGGLETGVFLLAVAAFLFVVSRVTPWLEWRRAMGAPHEAVITSDGIVFEGSVYPFRSFLVFWHGVTFQDPKKKNPATLVFSFTQLVGRFIIQPFEVVVPVPPGEEETARRVVRDLSRNSPEE